MPGTGMKVPMRYTTSAPTRNSRRLRMSPRRPASASAAAGLENALLATSVLDAPARGGDRRARALGDGHALERDGLLELARQHHLGPFGCRVHEPGALQRREVDHRRLDQRQLVQAHLGPQCLHRRAEADFRQPALQRHLATLEADLVVAALAGALALDAAAAGLALAGRGAAPDAQPGPARAGTGPEIVQSHCAHLNSTP